MIRKFDLNKGILMYKGLYNITPKDENIKKFII
jgi:hypothetical protein